MSKVINWIFQINCPSSRAKTLTLQDEGGQLHNVLVEGGGHGARLQVRLELQEELVPRDLLPQLARAARVELDPKVELVHAAPCRKYDLSFHIETTAKFRAPFPPMDLYTWHRHSVV